MNNFIKAIKELDVARVEQMIGKDAKWLTWAEADGKSALHYLGSVSVGDDVQKADASLQILKLLLGKGMDINAVHRIPDQNCGHFPATPLWYAYTRGRNKLVYKHLLSAGADPEHCMFAIAWYDDVDAAALFKKHGATIDDHSIDVTPFMSAYHWRRYKTAQWFLQNGADVNATDGKGNTVLYYAVKRKDKAEQINLLLSFGANPNHENQEGISPKKLAEGNRQKGVLKLFAERNP